MANNYRCAFAIDGICDILENGIEGIKCLGSSRKCSFRKTQPVIDKITKKVNARLNSLSEEKQLHISEKYYNGEYPWKEGV